MRSSRITSELRPRGPVERCRTALLASFLLPIAPVVCLTSQTTGEPGLVSLRLEQRQGDVTKDVQPKKIFHAGDVIRFRVTSGIAAYLYVLNQGTSGETATLFPTAASAENTRVEQGQIRSVPPDGDGWFEVTGPAGFDTVYFLLSATPINLPPTATGNSTKTEDPKPAPQLSAGVLPRCDDEIFKARGECLDPTAGVAPLAAGASVPRELIPLAGAAARDIFITGDGNDVDVRPALSGKLPLIYTFRLAHLE